MKKQIWSLLDSFKHVDDTTAFNEVFAACCAWLKLSKAGQLDDLHDYDGLATKDKLVLFLNDCVDVNFESTKWGQTDEELNHLVKSLRGLLNAKVITFKDLSDTITEFRSRGSKRTGEFTIPIEICELGVGLLEEKVQTVYCPFTNGYDFALNLPDGIKKFGETNDQSELFYSEVHCLLLGKKFHLVNSDPIFSPSFIGEGGLQQFDNSIAMPRFNLKFEKDQINDIWGRFPEKSYMSEVYYLRHMLAQTKNRIVFFVPNGFLFRSSAGEKQIKQSLLDKGWISAVIALPSNLLPHTQVQFSALVLDKTKTDSNIKFIDASGDDFMYKASRTQNKLVNIQSILESYHSTDEKDWSKYAHAADIVDSDFNLSASRYVLSDKEIALNSFLASHKTKPLDELAEIIRPQPVKHDEKGIVTFKEFNVSSLNEIGELTNQSKYIKVNALEQKRVRKQAIISKDILVVCKGSIGKVGIVSNQVEENAIASQSFAILRIKPHETGVTSESLYQYLLSEYGQSQLTMLATGTNALMLSSNDLKSIRVPLFTIEKLKQIDEIRNNTIKAQRQIEKLKEDIRNLNINWM